jgi:hypothetical protein
MDNDAHAAIFRDLRSRIAAICDILRSMLTWQSSDRPEADYLLTSPVWSRDAEPSTNLAPHISPKDTAKRVEQSVRVNSAWQCLMIWTVLAIEDDMINVDHVE